MSDLQDMIAEDVWRGMSPGERERFLMDVHKARLKNPSIGVGMVGYFVLWWDNRGRAIRKAFDTRKQAEEYARFVHESDA